MKKILLLIIIIITTFCKAQQEYPLRTDYTETPNYSYLKDTNNELSSFVGTYEATYQDKKITLFINKLIHKFFDNSQYKHYKDVLSIRYIIKSSSGHIVQDTQGMNLPEQQLRHTIYSMWVEDNGNKLLLYYGGTNCGVGWGSIILKKLNDTQMSWEYRPNDIILDDSRCPVGTDIKIYLPETKDLVFTKQ
ncbi:hypothetical protein SAMN05421786_107199 [Chryseobacterium ureilyticum]|uniref:DUF6705 domain-containing protein n=1 Tax=Chryseobacterium ureilyticum TaxID=373668 RepID=A0A1N7Q461_9FLAO|nr:DUF6705 family protein [Chryseobacterium ureilyticum]SIT17648.1 hypothetical protein SAMN05421786_107199 [Chryseobacterium ureilyticum]